MKQAIIYVRGNNKEMQEVYCKLYAAEVGYNILFATDDIKEVKDCDVLLVSNPSRISREEAKYFEVINDFKAKGIEVESVAHHESAVDYYSFANMLFQ